MTARSAHLPSYRSIPLRPLTGAMPPWPLVLGSDAVTVGPLATKGEFRCSVKAVTAMTMTIAAMMATMAPLPHSPSRSLRFGIASPPFEPTASPMVQNDPEVVSPVWMTILVSCKMKTSTITTAMMPQTMAPPLQAAARFTA
jgi:hypothetical protein